MSFASDVASVLESLGYGVWGGGTTVGATIFLNHEPPAPAVCTTLYGVGGAPDTQDFDGNTYGERPLQIRMRDDSAANLETRMESLYKLWAAWGSYPAYFLKVKMAGKALYAYPQDDNNNFIASVNIRVIQGS